MACTRSSIPSGKESSGSRRATIESQGRSRLNRLVDLVVVFVQEYEVELLFDVVLKSGDQVFSALHRKLCRVPVRFVLS